MTDSFQFSEVFPDTGDFYDYQEARYAVFCEEFGRVEATGQFNSRGNSIETDRFDTHSKHFIARDKVTGELAGFVRVIMPSSAGLNISDRYVIDQPLPFGTAEISRFAVTPKYRKPSNPYLMLGLYREVLQVCQTNGIEHCVAAMDKRFGRLLNTSGLPFKAIGPTNYEVSPARSVYITSANGILASLKL